MGHIYMVLLVTLIITTIAAPLPFPVLGEHRGLAHVLLAEPLLLSSAPSNLYMTVDDAAYLIGINVIVARGGGFYITGRPVIDAAAAPNGLIVLLSNGTLMYLGADMHMLWSAQTGYTEIMEPHLRVVEDYVVVYRSPSDYIDYAKIYRLDTGTLAATITRQDVPSHGYAVAIGPSYIVELLATGDGRLSLAIYSINGTLLYQYGSDGAILSEYPVATASLSDAAIVFIAVPEASKLRVLLYNGTGNWFSINMSGAYHGWGAVVAEELAASEYRVLVTVPGVDDTYAAYLDLGRGGILMLGEYYAPLPTTRYYTAEGWIAYPVDQQHVVAINGGGVHTYTLDEPFSEPLFDVDVWCVNDTWLLVANHDEKTVIIDTVTGGSATIARNTRLYLDGYYATVPGKGVYRVSPSGLVGIDELAAAKGYAADPFTPGIYYRAVVKLNGSLTLQKTSVSGTVLDELVLGTREPDGYVYIYRSLMGGYIYVAVPIGGDAELYIVDPGMRRVVEKTSLLGVSGSFAFYEDGGRIVIIDTGYSEIMYKDTLYSDTFYSGLSPGRRYSYTVRGSDLIVAGIDGGVRYIESRVAYASWIAPGVLAYIVEGYGGEPELRIYSYTAGMLYSAAAGDAKILIGKGLAAILFQGNHTLLVTRFTQGAAVTETYTGVYDASTWSGKLYISWLNGTISQPGSPGIGGYAGAAWMPGPPVLRVAGVFIGLQYSGVEERSAPTLLPYVESLRLDIEAHANQTLYNATLHVRVMNMSSGEPAAHAHVNISIWNEGWSSTVLQADGEGRVRLRVLGDGRAVLLDTPGGVPVMYPLRPVAVVFTGDGGANGYCVVDGYNYTHISIVYGVSYRIRYSIGAERDSGSDPAPLYTGIDGGVYRNATGWAAARSGGNMVNNTMVLLGGGGSTAHLYLSMRTEWRKTVELRGRVSVGGAEEFTARAEAWYMYTYSGFYGLGYTTTVYGKVVAEDTRTVGNTYELSPNESSEPGLSIVEIHTRGKTFYALILDNIAGEADDIEVAAVRINGTDYTEQVAGAITGESDRLLAETHPVVPNGNYTIDFSVALYRIGLLVSAEKAGVALRGNVEVVIRGRGGMLNYTIALDTASPAAVYHGGEEYPTAILDNLLVNASATVPPQEEPGGSGGNTTGTGGGTSGSTGGAGRAGGGIGGNETENGSAAGGEAAGGAARGEGGGVGLGIVALAAVAVIALAAAALYFVRRR